MNTILRCIPGSIPLGAFLWLIANDHAGWAWLPGALAFVLLLAGGWPAKDKP